MTGDRREESWAGTGWTPKPEYTSETDDLAADFYAPAMDEAIKYDRITGFFSSGAFLLYWPSLRGFVERRGRMRILCSPRLSDRDVEGLEKGYVARDDTELAAHLRLELEDMLGREQLRKPALAFAALISRGVIEVRLATVTDQASAGDKRMFHDKVGLFEDPQGCVIGFRGSPNETYLGLSASGNIESIDAWPSWTRDRDSQRVEAARPRFERLWAGEAKGVRVSRLPDEMLALLAETSMDTDWRELLDELAAMERHEVVSVPPTAPDGRTLRRQQVRGLAAWRDNGYRGVLAHATGSGKTVTGICAVAEHDGPVLIVVPNRLVAGQWMGQLRAQLGGTRRMHLAGDGDTRWRERLRHWMTDSGQKHVVVALNPTASDETFRNQLRQVPSLLLIGDEVHRLGAPSYRQILTIDAERRLGLSATPERAGDAEGTAVIFDYLDRIVDRFTLRDAMTAGPDGIAALCPYRYEPSVVTLDADELSEWKQYSKKIGRALARQGEGGARSPAVTALIMQRARVAKKAKAKVSSAAALVRDHFESGQHWLVYCDDKEQMGQIAETLSGWGLPVLTYHSDMTGDKEGTLGYFRKAGGVVVSIKCLDEGVDIPECDHAVIVASSRNPREFIQRRGRVLRSSPTKSFATIYDLLVVPQDEMDESTRSLVWSELARAARFAGDALNSGARLPLERACEDLGIDLQDLYDTLDDGVEPDDEAD